MRRMVPLTFTSKLKALPGRGSLVGAGRGRRAVSLHQNYDHGAIVPKDCSRGQLREAGVPKSRCYYLGTERVPGSKMFDARGTGHLPKT